MYIQVLVLVLGSLGYCYLLVTEIPKGLLRVISLLPVFYLFSILPWQFSSSALARGLSSFFITWITSFKLLLFAYDRGPLLFHQTYLDFAIVAIFPLKMRSRSSDHNKFSHSPNYSSLVVIPLIIVPVVYSQNYNVFLKFQLFLCITTLTWLYMVQAVTRYELVPLFNHPYLATSLQDFWGRRWNRMSSDILRQTVYDPTRKSLEGITGLGAAKVVATISTLVVSGIMHELAFYYITCGSKPTWEVAWFFILHGLCMVLEAGLKRLAKVKGWTPLQPAVSIVLTVGFAIVTCYWLLILPVWRSTQGECLAK
ncbi:probable long-chain-alcohol O-fatty-acyltransferase 6 [Humulus lupulus]|uniref:probable long-chain-alcohol O-fatty-acyltransferase 6 n=1 Tax=Humulus lupulus TaxID=3486 RepID=UPI002B407C0B|nr:probable long-chain-alcohol O-fatty-acyltransferase 6 [Humulus lupulus]